MTTPANKVGKAATAAAEPVKAVVKSTPAGVAAHASSTIAPAVPKAVNPPPVVPAPVATKPVVAKRKAEEAPSKAEAKQAKVESITINPLDPETLKALTEVVNTAFAAKDLGKVSATQIFTLGFAGKGFGTVLKEIYESKEGKYLTAHPESYLERLSHLLGDKGPNGLRSKVVAIIQAHLIPTSSWGISNAPAVDATWAIINPMIAKPYDAQMAKDPVWFNKRVDTLCHKHGLDQAMVHALIGEKNWRGLINYIFAEDLTA